MSRWQQWPEMHFTNFLEKEDLATMTHALLHPGSVIGAQPLEAAWKLQIGRGTPPLGPRGRHAHPCHARAGVGLHLTPQNGNGEAHKQGSGSGGSEEEEPQVHSLPTQQLPLE